jgi:hypothetical protein
MNAPSAKRVAAQHEARRLFHEAHGLLEAMDRVASQGSKGRVKTAGEVIFKKDMSGDASQWAYATPGPSERILGDFNYSPKNMKPLAKTLRGSLAALGHVLSAYNMFAKIKSARVSPDGSLGGKGYIQKIADMRKQFMNVVEALSALSDTLYDEVNAPHWSVISRQESPEEKKEVEELLSDVDDIRDNPEEWAKEQIEEEFGEDDEPKGSKKTASVAARWLEGAK